MNCVNCQYQRCKNTKCAKFLLNFVSSVGTRRVGTSLKDWKISAELPCFRWERILLSSFKYTLKDHFWFRPRWLMADWRERQITTAGFEELRVTFLFDFTRVGIFLYLQYTWILFYTVVLQGLKEAQWCLLLWIYYESSCPSGIANSVRNQAFVTSRIFLWWIKPKIFLLNILCFGKISKQQQILVLKSSKNCVTLFYLTFQIIYICNLTFKNF